MFLYIAVEWSVTCRFITLSSLSTFSFFVHSIIYSMFFFRFSTAFIIMVLQILLNINKKLSIEINLKKLNKNVSKQKNAESLLWQVIIINQFSFFSNFSKMYNLLLFSICNWILCCQYVIKNENSR